MLRIYRGEIEKTILSSASFLFLNIWGDLCAESAAVYKPAIWL